MAFLKDCQEVTLYDTIIFMTATGHALIGAVIAAKIGNPYLAIPIAIVSHFAADIYPHWDSGTNGSKKTKKRFLTEAVVDVLVGFVASYMLLTSFFPQTNLLYALIIVIAAQLPDWATAPYLIGIKKQPFISFYKFQSRFNTRLDKPWGIITQIFAISLLILLAKFF